MFLHCVALDKAEVGEPWNKFGREANSLFLLPPCAGIDWNGPHAADAGRHRRFDFADGFPR